MVIYVDERLFNIANEIAEAHVPMGWFPGIRRVVKVIRLRTAIYNALCHEAGVSEIEYPEQLARG